MQREIIFRPATPRDDPGIREVLNATYGKQAASSITFDWWCKSHAAVSHAILVAECNQRVVGLQPIQFFSYQERQCNLLGGMLTGVAVHPEFRRQGIFLKLVQTSEAEAWRIGARFVVTMPNERSRPGFLKMGYTDLGQRRFAFRMLDPNALGRRLHALLDPIIGIGSRVTQAVLKSCRSSGQHEIVEYKEVPTAIDQLEQMNAELYPGVRLQRIKSWWDWRYRQNPERDYRLFVARDKAAQIRGFAATASEVRDGLSVAYLMDYAVCDHAAYHDLLAGLQEGLRSFGAQVLCAVVSAPEQLRSLRRSGFWIVPKWAPIKRFYTVARFNPEQAENVPAAWHKISGWYQTLGDWDNL